jgi:hypothetical protein
MKPAILRAATLALCLITLTPLAVARCVSRAEIAAAIAQQLPEAKTALLAAGEAQAFLAAYNAEPPRTSLAADEILLVELVSDPAITRAVLFEHGCFTQAGPIPRLLVTSLLNAIERSKL